MMGFFYQYHLPRIESWLMVEIENYSEENLPLKVWPQNLKISFFPLGLDIKNIKFKPKAPLSETLAPGEISNVDLELSLLQLIRGRIRVSRLAVSGSDIKLILKHNPDEKKEAFTQAQWSELLEMIYRLPIDQLDLDKINILARVEKLQTSGHIKDLSATLENRYETLKLDLLVPDLTLKETNKSPRVKVFLETKLLLDSSNVKLSALKLRKQNSFLVATGDFSGSYVEGNIEQYRIQARTQIETQSVLNTIKAFLPKYSNHEMSGIIAGEINLNQPKNERPELTTNLKSEKLFFNNYEIGNTELKARSTQEVLSIKEFNINNSAGSARLSEAKMEFNDEFSFSSGVVINQLEVAQLLRAINVGDTPLVVNLNANIPCKGAFYPEFKLECKGKANVNDLWVYTGSNKKTIVKAEGFKLNGGFTVDGKKVSYNSKIEIGESKGSSKGVINYKTGFNINYDASKLFFKDIINLANLKLEGSGNLSGTTKGNSKTATMSLNLDADKVWLEDYLLGNASSDISYKKSKLSFNNLKGVIDSTQYQGDVIINLSKNTIQLQAKSNYLNTTDLIKAFSRKINFDLPITGTGQATVTAQGPLDFSKLSYDLYSQVYRGSIYEESYDVLQASIRSTKGLVSFSNSYLKKGRSQAFVTGTINSSGIADLKIQGENFKLKELDHLRRRDLEIGGDFSFSSTLQGPILDPNYKLNSEFKKMTIFDEQVKDSKVLFGVDKQKLYTQGELLGDTISFDINYPFNNNDDFYFKAKTNNWNFTKYLALIATDEVQRTFNSSVTSTINLSSQQGGIKKSSGFINVDEFFIQRGNIKMTNKDTMRLIFTDGVIETEAVTLVGEESFVSLESAQKNSDNLDLTAKAKIPMGLLAIILPVSDISGQLSGSVKLSGNYKKLNIVGSSFVENGFFAISGFPHAFDNISADLLFNEKNVLINSVDGQLAGGALTGSGRIQLLGINNIPVSLNMNVNNASFEVPAGFNTQGQARLQIVGNWFPYTLKGQYVVNKGLVTTSFIESNGDKSKQIQPSAYLPQYLTKQSFEPLNLNLNVILNRPVVIKNPEADAKVSGQVLLQGYPDKPLLTGQLQIERGGQITFRDNEFDILSANIEYNTAPPEQPKLYVSAKTQIISDDITYDINLILQGTASNPNFKLSSTPPLEENEIVSLLALGVTPSQLDERVDPSEQATQTSYQLGTALLSSPLGKEIKNRFGVDVQISSGFDEVDKKSVPTVTVKKQITDDLSAQASRTIEQIPKNNVKMKYNINQNLSIIGLWDSSEANLAEPERDTTSDTIGVDLEYKIRFK
ncbi:MAG: translocation/assembly module TamB [Bdellovibrionales bacterium]|nr:translocation/assembly module TamB [Bdellovibrionales bacterium]